VLVEIYQLCVIPEAYPGSWVVFQTRAAVLRWISVGVYSVD